MLSTTMDHRLSSDTISGQSKKNWKQKSLLSLQIIGVVYGQLSTAPLYVFGTINPDDLVSVEVVYELFSFIFWTLTIIALIKYASIVLGADDHGEGGIVALYSLLCRHAKVGLLPSDRSTNEVMHCEEENPCQIKGYSRSRKAIERHKFIHYILLFLALFGSGMAFGDGVLTPALSVLSASSGVERSLSGMPYIFSKSQHVQEILSNDMKKYVPVIIACAILIVLFKLQNFGTRKIGFMFAPIIIVWLFFISGVGLYNIFHWDKTILWKISPTYLFRFFQNVDIAKWRLLGSIILCVAGSEAMFADLGHFSKKSIKVTFVCFIYPLLVVSYAGQAAYITKNLNAEDFNHLGVSVPSHLQHIFTVISLFASAVGSQACITACFSIISQCLTLGCFPRVKVIHTSEEIHGQVYIPDVNWLLMILSLAVTIGFGDMVKIGNATGTAVISGMLVTTVLMSLVIALYWEKSLIMCASFLVLFGTFEATYLSACMLNFHKGAWYLFLLLVLCMTTMLSWHYGTMKKYEFDLENKVPTEWLTEYGPSIGVCRVPGIGFIYTDILTGIPAFFSHFVTNLPAFHELLIFVSFKSMPQPYVAASERYLIGRIGHKDRKFYRCVVRYGYCDHIRDTDDFEEQIISSIGEFISMEENDVESLSSSERRMIVIGNSPRYAKALVSIDDDRSCYAPTHTSVLGNSYEIKSGDDASDKGSPLPSSSSNKKKKVRFILPEESPKMDACVRKELQDLVDARESGSAHFLGQSHLVARKGSSIVKRFLMWVYVLWDKNCREPPVALNIPHAALVEVGMIYNI